MNKIKFFFIFSLIIGLLIRLYFIFSRDIFTDEVFYYDISINNSFSNILTFNHWIKDHGAFFLIFLKILTFISKDIIFLRLFNLILYVISSIVFFKFFYKLKLFKVAIIFSLIYSFNSYFIFMSAMISPFNLVLFLSFLAIIQLFDYFLIKKSLNKLFLFNILSILSFYADFSSIYFFLGIFILFFIFIFRSKNNSFIILISLLIQSVLILPGIFYVLNNIDNFAKINPLPDFNMSFFQFIKIFSDMIIFRIGKIYSLIVFIFLFMNLITMFLRVKKEILKVLSFFVFLSFVISLIFLFFFTKNYFGIFTERSFWYFYFLKALAFSLIVILIKKKYFIIYLSFLLLIFFIRSLDIYGYSFSGRVPDRNFLYKQLIPEIKNSDIIYFDKEYSYVPLKYYYLYSKKGIVVKSISELKAILQSNSDEISIVIFDEYEKDVIKKINLNNKKIKIFISSCDKNNCKFERKI